MCQEKEKKFILKCFFFFFTNTQFWPQGWIFLSHRNCVIAGMHSGRKIRFLCWKSFIKDKIWHMFKKNPSQFCQTWMTTQDTFVSLLGFWASRLIMLAKATQWKSFTVSCLIPYPVYRCKILSWVLASRLIMLAKAIQWKSFTVSCLVPYPVYRCKILPWVLSSRLNLLARNNQWKPVMPNTISCQKM